MDDADVDYYLQVIKNVIDEKAAPSVDGAAKHIEPTAEQDDIVAAITALMTDGRIDMVTSVAGWDADWQSIQTAYYFPTKRQA